MHISSDTILQSFHLIDTNNIRHTCKQNMLLHIVFSSSDKEPTLIFATDAKIEDCCYTRDFEWSVLTKVQEILWKWSCNLKYADNNLRPIRSVFTRPIVAWRRFFVLHTSLWFLPIENGQNWSASGTKERLVQNVFWCVYA